MLLLSIICLLTEISFLKALTCNNYDKGNATEATCTGAYCMIMKYTAITKNDAQVPTVIKGCYNWKVNLPEMGCYVGLPTERLQNLVVCFCNSDNCNTDDMLNSTPKPTRQFTCEHSTQKTCTGYGCMVSYCIPSNNSQFRAKTCTELFRCFTIFLQELEFVTALNRIQASTNLKSKNFIQTFSPNREIFRYFWKFDRKIYK